MKLQATISEKLPVVLFLTIIFLAAAIARAQPDAPFVENILPGSAYAGAVPGPNGRLYGVTYSGGTFDKGTLYSVDQSLSSVIVHHHFDGADGESPYGELVYDPASGRFYGTTGAGGALGAGTIFAFDPAANALTTLRADFGGFSEPQAPLVVSNGFIYGSLQRVNGAVFRTAINGSDLFILHAFADFGAMPQALTLGQDGKLYGVTVRGGLNCFPMVPTETCGTVFRLRPVLPGDADVQFQTLYQMQDPFDRSPQRTPVYGSDNLLYFNTHNRIFRLNPENPANTFQMLWQESGGDTTLSIVEGADNRLYAASYGSGSAGLGRIFSINRDGSDQRNIRNFLFTAGAGANGPYGRLYRTAAGELYGTTEYSAAAPFFGTVFRIDGGVTNTPPALGNITVTSPIDENSSAVLAGAIADPNPGDAFTLTVDWGDGSAPQVFNYAAGTTAFSETHQYRDDNPTATPSDSYAIVLTLSDGSNSDSDSAAVTVNNVAPVLSNLAANPTVLTVGGSTTVSGNFSDAGAADTHRIVIDWGDGSPATILDPAANVNAFSAPHQYAASGVFNISVTATDDDGGSAGGTISVTVNPPPPVVPNAPTNLTANALSTTQIDLAWTDNSSGEDGFLIERCAGNGKCTSFVQIAQVGAGVNAFSDAGLSAATNYTYRVRAFNAAGNSAYSTTAKERTLRR